MKRTYQVVTKPSTLSSRELAECLSKDGQLLLPLVERLERGEKAIDEVIDVMGRATVEAVLRMSALRGWLRHVFDSGADLFLTQRQRTPDGRDASVHRRRRCGWDPGRTCRSRPLGDAGARGRRGPGGRPLVWIRSNLHGE